MPIETFGNIDVTPFSNGSDYSSWRSRNCDKCALDYDWERNEGSCSLEEYLALSTLGGTIPLQTARMIGCGELQRQGEYTFATLNPRCSKFQCPDRHKAYGDTSKNLPLFL